MAKLIIAVSRIPAAAHVGCVDKAEQNQHMSAYVSIRQHAGCIRAILLAQLPAYVSIPVHVGCVEEAEVRVDRKLSRRREASVFVLFYQ